MGQVPVSVQVDAAWIRMSSERTEVNKLSVVDVSVHDASLSAHRFPLNTSATTKTMQIYFLTHCLVTEFITGARAPHEAWGALSQQTKTLWIIYACAAI